MRFTVNDIKTLTTPQAEEAISNYLYLHENDLSAQSGYELLALTGSRLP